MRMSWKGRLAAIVLSLAAPAMGMAAPRADDLAIDGLWKLVIIPPLQEIELMVVDVTTQDGRPLVRITDAPEYFKGKPELGAMEIKGDEVTLGMNLEGASTPFRGRYLASEGNVLGTMRLKGMLYPARLEHTNAKTVKVGADRSSIVGYIQTRNPNLPLKSRAEALRVMLKDIGTTPKADNLYADLLLIAEDAAIPPDEARAIANDWLSAAKPYGEEYTAVVRGKIARTLAGKPTYSGIALQFAEDAEKNLPADASNEIRALTLKGLAEAARLAGQSDVARSARSRADALEAKIDAVYRTSVPPFPPDAPAARAAATAPRGVVLMELFSGAQCGPCVGSDVAFDALMQSYPTTDLVPLQYHVHVPGPDPMANADALARQSYYPNNGTAPAAFFNGRPLAGAGGTMDEAKSRYDAFRKVIETDLAAKPGATIDLQVRRDGKKIAITAAATVKEATPGADIKLRLALVEREVRYVGGNGLRFHHNVVRTMPGGPLGVNLVDGQAQTIAQIDPADLKRGLATYLADYAKKNGPYADTPPLDLDDLAVIAFVQDDGTRAILHAVMVPVGE